MKRVFWSLDVYLNRPSYQLAEGYSYTRVSHIHIIHHTHWMECLVLCSLTYLINTLRTIHQRSHIHNSHLPSIYLHTYLMWWLILGWDGMGWDEMRCAENEIKKKIIIIYLRVLFDRKYFRLICVLCDEFTKNIFKSNIMRYSWRRYNYVII